jgi:hypothetical protein
MEYLIVLLVLVLVLFWVLAWAIRQALFVSYRRQVEDACGAGVSCRFEVVAGDARPQQIYDGVIRVGEAWLAWHGVPRRSLVGRN